MKAVYGYIKAVVKGVVKVMAKMGISTIQSIGARTSKPSGSIRSSSALASPGRPPRGWHWAGIAQEAQQQHARAFRVSVHGHTLDVHGQYQYRKDGELHLFNPAPSICCKKPVRTIMHVQGLYAVDHAQAGRQQRCAASSLKYARSRSRSTKWNPLQPS